MFQPVEEVPHRLVSIDRLHAGRAADQVVHGRADVVGDGRRDKRPFVIQSLRQASAVGGRRLPGEDQVGERAETERIKLGRAGVGIAELWPVFRVIQVGLEPRSRV
jgi:hypothetical protein